MNPHPLDRPAHAALSTRHAGFAQTYGAARRYDPAIVPFAAAFGDPSDLTTLVQKGDVMALVQAAPLKVPAGFTQELMGDLLQMLATGPVSAPEDPRIQRLGPSDAVEMTALAQATRPGPFTDRALDNGRFWGIRQGGHLVAMAGERMATDGFVEISGVCAAEAARGQGLARLLSCHVAAVIQSEGDVPFLHSYASNAAAVSLYRSIGFAIRSEMRFGVFRRVG